MILPGLGREPAAAEPELLHWREHQEGLLLAPLKPLDGESHDAAYALLQRLDAEAAAHETVRLLYVAATRARRELHLFGHASAPGKRTAALAHSSAAADRPASGYAGAAAPPARDPDPQQDPAAGAAGAAGGARPDPLPGPPPRPARRSLLATLWPALEPAFRACEAATAAAAAPPRPCPRVTLLRRLPADWHPPEAAPPLASEATATAPACARAEAPISYRWAGALARHVGTVVHDALHRIACEGLERWTPARVHATRPHLRAALAAAGVASEELERAVQRAADTLCAALRDPRGRWILAPHAHAENELRLTGVVDGVLVRAIVDRTFVGEDGTRWLIDYKTGAHEGGGVAAFLDCERERYRAQMDRYGALLRRMDARPIRFGL